MNFLNFMRFFNYFNKKQDEEHNITFITYDLLEVIQKNLICLKD